MEFNKKGQGSLEYLLIIGGGILVAVVIIGAIISLAGTGTGGSTLAVGEASCNSYISEAQCKNANLNGIAPGPVPVDDADCATGYKSSGGLQGGTTVGECCFTDGVDTTLALNKQCILSITATAG